MKSRDRSRGIEGSLLVFSLLILVIGSLLVFLGRTREGLPAEAIDLNSATADEIAVALDTDPALAARLVERRTATGGFVSVQQAARASVFITRDEAAKARQALASAIRDVNAADSREFSKALHIPMPVAKRIAEYRDRLPAAAFKRAEDVLRVPILDDRAVAGLGSRLYVRHPASVLGQYLRYGLLAALLLIAAPIMLRKAGVGGDPFLLPIGFFLAGLGALELFSIKDPLRDAPVYTHHILGLCM
jgi:DNA uptake protein ComE-like DNA-binding protein